MAHSLNYSYRLILPLLTYVNSATNFDEQRNIFGMIIISFGYFPFFNLLKELIGLDFIHVIKEPLGQSNTIRTVEFIKLVSLNFRAANLLLE